jgi:hypothetical protein
MEVYTLMSKELQYTIPNFIGGLHEEVDYSLLKNNEASSLQNVNLDDGVLKSARVPSIYLSSIPGVPKSIMTYYRNNVPYLMAIINGHLYKYDGTVWTDLGGGLDVNASVYDYINDNVQSNDVFVFTNGVDNVKIYEGGAGFRDLKKLGYTSAADPVNNTIKGKYMVLHYERLWIADDNGLYASTSDRAGFDIEDFTTPTDVTEVNQHGAEVVLYTNDGTKVIGMSVVFDDIIIWKERSIHKIFGTDPSNYQKISFSAKGGISDKSIAVHETGAFFIDRAGIYFYNGTQALPISNPIKKTWKTLSIEDMQKAVGFIYNDKYILSVGNIVIEYDITNKNFVINSGYKVDAVTDYKNKTLISQGDTNIYEYAINDINNAFLILSPLLAALYAALKVMNATSKVVNSGLLIPKI